MMGLFDSITAVKNQVPLTIKTQATTKNVQ